jgi:hypothetical protein
MNNIFHHYTDTPTSFYFDYFPDSESDERIRSWFITRQPKHVFRGLYNNERYERGHNFELVFETDRDAAEFKLLFL